MRVVFETIDGKKDEIESVIELCFSKSAGVACDSLWISFLHEKYIGEIAAVKMYNNDILIFNGFCDCQKISENKNGYAVCVYARSTACILVDNETMPYTYDKPSAKQLCRCAAEQFGFVCKLPEIYSDMKYEVTSGSSCYGAISNFVSLLTGDSIYITPDNEIIVLQQSKNVKSLNLYTVLSAVHTINRSEPVSKIKFKKNAGDPRYNMNTQARLGAELKIQREKYISLSSLPQWQRDNTVLKRLAASYENYYTLEIMVSGFADESLLQRFCYESQSCRYEDYYLADLKFMCSEKGEFTKLVLKKNINIKEITYVDK